MKRTQLNVSIDPKLLEKIKESARVSGKSLVSYVSDCFVNQVKNLPVETLDSRFQMIEQRLQSIEKKLDFHKQESQFSSLLIAIFVQSFEIENLSIQQAGALFD